MKGSTRHVTARRHRVMATAVVALTAAAFLPLGGAAKATATFAFKRFAGADRYDTARLLAQSTFGGGASDAVIARGDLFPDALAGSYLAGAKTGPILLTAPGSIPQPTLDALKALHVKAVTLLGGTAAISTAVETQLKGTASSAPGNPKLVVSRIAGATRFDTARKLAEQVGGGNVGSQLGKLTAIVTSGRNFPDALAGGPMSFASKFPTLLTEPGSLSPEAKDALTTLSIQQVLLLGGTAAVSKAVEDAIKAMNMSVTRLAGGDRAETAIAIANFELGSLGFANAHANLARGDNFPDALAGGPHGGTDKAPILLTTSTKGIPTKVTWWLEDHHATLADGHIFGGTAAVTTDQQGAATAAAQAGIVVLDNLTAPVGGIITGRVTDPNNQGFASVLGCGFSFPNNSVSFDANGLFSLTLPASQVAGTCKLTFSVQPNNAPPPPATEDFTITVTAIAPGATAAPDLLSASRNDNDITFLFDAPLGLSVNPGNFHFYTFGGLEWDASRVSVAGSTAVASFDEGGVLNATTAAVEYGAVQGGTGLKNPECSVKLQNVTKQAGVTSEPDLVAVGNFGSLGNHADYTFDDPVRVGNQGGFELVLDGGLRVNSSAATVSSQDSKTVTAIFPGLPSGKTLANIVRGVVLGATTSTPGAVQGQQDVGDPRFSNPLESVNLPPGNGKTVLPDLVSAAVNLQSGTITYTFDQAISSTIVAGNFQAYDSGANLTTTAQALVSGSNSVVATFGPGLGNDPPVLASVFRGAVNGTGASPKGSTDASVPLQTVVFQAGTTSLPDLRTVAVSTTSTGHKMVTFTFDSPLPFPAGPNAPAADFHLYDAAAKQYTSGSSGVVSGNTASFTGPSTFTDAVIGSAVVGAVDDASAHDNPGPPGFPITPLGSKFPEGCAAVH